MSKFYAEAEDKLGCKVYVERNDFKAVDQPVRGLDLSADDYAYTRQCLINAGVINHNFLVELDDIKLSAMYMNQLVNPFLYNDITDELEKNIWFFLAKVHVLQDIGTTEDEDYVYSRFLMCPELAAFLYLLENTRNDIYIRSVRQTGLTKTALAYTVFRGYDGANSYVSMLNTNNTKAKLRSVESTLKQIKANHSGWAGKVANNCDPKIKFIDDCEFGKHAYNVVTAFDNNNEDDGYRHVFMSSRNIRYKDVVNSNAKYLKLFEVFDFDFRTLPETMPIILDLGEDMIIDSFGTTFMRPTFEAVRIASI